MTAFLYLNDVEEGGETRFTRVPKKPQAKAPVKDSSDWERLRWPCPSAFTIASQRVHHCTQTARRSSRPCLSRPAPAPAPNFSALHPVRGRSSCGRTCSTRTLTWATLSRDTRRAPCGAASSTGPTSGFTSTPSAPARYDLPPSPRPVPWGGAQLPHPSALAQGYSVPTQGDGLVKAAKKKRVSTKRKLLSTQMPTPPAAVSAKRRTRSRRPSDGSLGT